MYNDSDEISASEINKFSYCPYQFYYGRKYGQKYIKEIRDEYLKEIGYTDKSKSNFVKGNEFHNNYNTKEQRNYPIFKLMFIVILIVIGFALYDKYSIYVFDFFSSFNKF